MSRQTKDRRPLSRRTLTLLGLGVFSIATLILLLLPLWKVARALKWEAVPCKVISSNVEEEGRTGRKSYRVAITYQYEIDGKQYQTDRYNFFTRLFTGGRGPKLKKARAYPVGKEMVCYVNPANPNEAVLHRGLSWTLWFGVLSAGLAAVCIADLLHQRRKERFQGQKTILSSNRDSLHAVWGIALCVTLFFSFVVTVAYDQFAGRFHSVTLGLGLFAMVSAFLLGKAIHATLRFWKFGESVFEPGDTPAVVGGVLEGVILPGGRIRLYGADRKFAVRLQSIHRYQSKDGKNQEERVCWEDTQTLESCDGALRVAFSIPPTAHKTTVVGPENGYYWRLEATSEREGVDYYSQFLVPVSDHKPSAGEAARSEELRANQREVSSKPSSIRRDEDRDGRTVFIFPAFRNFGESLVWLVVSAIAFSIAYFMWHESSGLTLIFTSLPIGLINLFGLFFFCAAVSISFKSTRVVVNREGISVTTWRFGIPMNKRINRGEIRKIKTYVGMKSGALVLRSIQIQTRDGSEYEAGSGIEDKDEADLLATEMSRLVGLEADVAKR